MLPADRRWSDRCQSGFGGKADIRLARYCGHSDFFILALMSDTLISRSGSRVGKAPSYERPHTPAEYRKFAVRSVAHSLLGAPHWGDSRVWLMTRVRPTIAECEGLRMRRSERREEMLVIEPCLARRAVKAPSADGWIHATKLDGFRLLKIAWGHGYRSPATSLPSSILRLITPPLWRSWSWRCRQLPADYHAIAFATAFIARHPIPEPGGFAGLARYRNFFVHAL